MIYNLKPPSLEEEFRIEALEIDLEEADSDLTEIWPQRTVGHAVVPRMAKYGGVRMEWGASFVYPFVADFSGNGKADLFLNTPDNNRKKFHLWSSTTHAPDTISTVISGLGVKTEVEYASLTNITDEVYTLRDDAGTRVGTEYFDIIFGSYVVSEIRRDTGLGSANLPVQSTHNYEYEGMAFSIDRGSAGFHKMSVIDSYGSELTTTTTTTFEQAFPYTGSVNETIIEVENGNLAKVMIGKTTVESRTFKNPVSGNSAIVLPIELSMRKLGYELDGDLISQSVTSKAAADVDDWGNVLEITETIGFGASDQFTTVTTNVYGTSETDKRFGRLSRSTVTKTRPLEQHGGSFSEYQTSTRASSFTYHPDTKVLLTETIEPDATGDDAYLTQKTTYGYDARGNILTTSVEALDGVSNVTRTATNTYTPDFRFIETSANAYGHTTTFTSDTLSGAVLTVEDPNDIVTVNTYDAFDRLMKVETSQAGGDNTGPAPAHTRRMRAAHAPIAAPGSAISVVKTWVEPNGSHPQYVFYDRMGREVRSASKSGAGDWLYTDTFYSVRGLVESVTRPFVAGSNNGSSWNGVLDYAHARYDALGRILIQTAPGGGVNGFEYDGRVTKQYQLMDDSSGLMFTGLPPQNPDVDALFGARVRTDYSLVTVTTDAAGQTIYVIDNADTGDDEGLWHVYDADGNLVITYLPKPTSNGSGVVAGERIQTVMGYDRRGNKTSMVDPNMGTWTYTYNGFGELKKQYDADDNLIQFLYDDLGRVTQRTDLHTNDGGQTYGFVSNSTWVYDTATNGKGLLASTANGSEYSQSFEYDSYSRLKKAHETIDGETFTMEYTFDIHGRPDTMTYPNGVKTLNNYDDAGFLGKIFRTDGGTNLLWDATDYDGIGGISEFALGNGLVSRLERNLRRGFVERVYTGTTSSDASIQDLEFGYKLVGHLNQRIDYNRNLREIMWYDARQRLQGVQLTTNLGQGNQTIHGDQSCNYDILGNLLGKFRNDGTEIWMDYIEGGRPNAVLTQGLEGSSTAEHFFAYNGNGSMLEKRAINSTGTLLQSYTWTPFNKPLTMENHGSGAFSIFHYGSDRQRVRQYMDKGALVGVREVKYVAGGLFEKEFSDTDGIGTGQVAVVTERAYISTPAGNVAVVVKEDDGTTVTDKTDYMHHDHQGTLVEVTNGAGDLIASYSYDAWGALRAPDNWQGDPQAAQAVEELSLFHNRSYTGHEPLQEFDLVHMNGRVYDPDLGRFISADPFVQSANDRQAFNRYTYVLNSPLSYTDPSGYFFDKIADFFGEYWRPIVAAVAGIATGGVLGGFSIAGFTYAGAITPYLGATKAAFFGAVVGGAVSGGINDGLRGAISGAAFGVAFWGVETGFDSFGLVSGFDSLEGGAVFAGKAVANGVVGGTEALIYGNNFLQGFATSASISAGSDAISILNREGPPPEGAPPEDLVEDWDPTVPSVEVSELSETKLFEAGLVEIEYRTGYNNFQDTEYGTSVATGKILIDDIRPTKFGYHVETSGPMTIDVAVEIGKNAHGQNFIAIAANFNGSISLHYGPTSVHKAFGIQILDGSMALFNDGVKFNANYHRNIGQTVSPLRKFSSTFNWAQRGFSKPLATDFISHVLSNQTQNSRVRYGKK